MNGYAYYTDGGWGVGDGPTLQLKIVLSADIVRISVFGDEM
jgi:hypothetical protein